MLEFWGGGNLSVIKGGGNLSVIFPNVVGDFIYTVNYFFCFQSKVQARGEIIKGGNLIGCLVVTGDIRE